MEIGLKRLGYVVSHEGKADAVATLRVVEYRTTGDGKSDWLSWGKSSGRVQRAKWTLTITRQSKTLWKLESENDDAMSIDQPAGKQVLDALASLPPPGG